MRILIYSFNNYYNRIVKRYKNVEDYGTPIISINSVNFNPADGIKTTHIIGSSNNQYDGSGDYMLCVDDATGEILYRWYILETVRQRGGQWAINLKRDVISDYLEHIISAPAYVEKATISETDPAIWNSEGLSVNQIKQSETLLKDETGFAWIIGYIDKDYSGGQVKINAAIQPNYTVEGLKNWDYYENVSNPVKTYNASETTLGVNIYAGKSGDGYKYTLSTKEGVGASSTPWTIYTGQIYAANGTIINGLNKCLYESNTSTLRARWNSFIVNANYDRTKALELQRLKGQYIYDSTAQALYKIGVRTYDTTKTYDVGQERFQELGGSVPDYVDKFIETDAGVDFQINPSYYVNVYEINVELTLERVADGEYTIDIPSALNRKHVVDAPYDMFCIPYGTGNIIVQEGNNEQTYSVDENIALSIAQGIGKALGTNIFDIQLLPYCPITNFIETGDGTLKMITTGTTEYTEIIGSNNYKTVLFWAQRCNGEKTIPLDAINVENMKLSNETDMYRLVSPNFNGTFEFSAAKMNGIKGFNVDYTYIPYSPYIHVNPIFGGLYGKDFDDARGLICQGDFSISYLSDPWIQYQVQNKNYANIFNRGTENLELHQEQERIKQLFGITAGTMQGGASGASVGAALGPYGAIAGAAIGTIASGAGGIYDYQMAQELREEALDYRKDMFNYSLENIQAQPNSLAKVTAYTKNNKIFPMLEYYTCTNTEKIAVSQKIAYNGMTVMRIDKFENFMYNKWSSTIDGVTYSSKNYMKGKIIHLEEVGEDYHVASEIANEMNKGAYFNVNSIEY